MAGFLAAEAEFLLNAMFAFFWSKLGDSGSWVLAFKLLEKEW